MGNELRFSAKATVLLTADSSLQSLLLFVCVCMHAIAHMLKSEDNSVVLIPSFCFHGFQASNSGCLAGTASAFYPVSHLSSPSSSSFWTGSHVAFMPSLNLMCDASHFQWLALKVHAVTPGLSQTSFFLNFMYIGALFECMPV